MSHSHTNYFSNLKYSLCLSIKMYHPKSKGLFLVFALLILKILKYFVIIFLWFANMVWHDLRIIKFFKYVIRSLIYNHSFLFSNSKGLV
jgi:hypothetical protein